MQGQTLGATAGSWGGTTPIHYAYQWQRNGVSLSGATSSNYVIGAGDVGYRLDVIASASNSAGSGSATSPATAVVASLPPAGGESPPPVLLPPPLEEQLGSGSAVVSASPTGPPSPSSGWHVAFADGFGAPVGTAAGQDNFWYPNEGSCCNASEDKNGNNANELQVYNSSQVKVGGEGLELVDTYWPNRKKAEGGYPVRNYVSGAVQTFPQYTPAGYSPFTWEPARGETWAFECYCKLPVNTGEVDPGWWSMDWGWHDEFDFFEEWGWSKWTSPTPTGVTWIYDTSGRKQVESWKSLYSMFDPSSGFHRYTTVVNSNNSIEEYIDGMRQTWLGINGVIPPPPYVTAAKMGLILSNALRMPEGTTADPAPNFKSGSRAFDVRSIAVYEDGGHAGQNVTGGGVAPGTVVR